MPVAKLNKVALHWREDGNPNGLPVVFANSLGTDLRLWDKVVPLLPKNLRLIRFDNRGHGLSSCPTGPYSLQDLGHDTAHLLDHLQVQNCVFIGLSIGGMIGQQLASDRPDLLRALVLSNTAATMGEPQMWQDRISTLRTGGMDALADTIMERWFSQKFRSSAELTAWRAMLIQTPVEGYVGCCQAIAGTDLSETTARLTLPVLGIGGTDDLACPSHSVAQTTATIVGSRFENIESAGHLPCVEKPEYYATLITDFIAELGNV